MEAIAELFIAIASAFLELLVHLIAAVLGSTFLAKHSKGMRQFLYVLCAISALHLFLGLTVPFMTNFNDYLLSPVFNRWMMLGSVVVLILVSSTLVAIDISADLVSKPAADKDINDSNGGDASTIRAPMVLIYILAFIIVFGGLSILTADNKRTTLREELCLAAAGKVSPIWKDRGENALTLAEKILRSDLHEKLPCRDIK